MRSKVASDLRERLAAARATSAELERSRSELIRQMRRTVREIRELRHHMLARQEGRAAAEALGPEGRLVARYRLTPREVEVAMLLSRGASNAAIAEVLDISAHTARHHTRHVLVKLGVHSRASAAAIMAREFRGSAPGEESPGNPLANPA